MVDHPVYFSLLSTLTKDTSLTLTGTQGFIRTMYYCTTLDAGICVMVQQIRLVMFSMNMVDHFMSFLLLVHEILVTAKRSKSFSPFFGFDLGWTLDWDLALGLSISC